MANEADFVTAADNLRTAARSASSVAYAMRSFAGNSGLTGGSVAETIVAGLFAGESNSGSLNDELLRIAGICDQHAEVAKAYAAAMVRYRVDYRAWMSEFDTNPAAASGHQVHNPANGDWPTWVSE